MGRGLRPFQVKMPNSAFNIANLLTISRLILIPVFVILVAYSYKGLAFFFFLAAGITDLLDGIIARIKDIKTPIGAFLDPLADKLLLVSAYFLLTLPQLKLVNRVPLWITIIIIFREIIIVIGAFSVQTVTGKFRIIPSIPGKITTDVQLGTMFLILLFNYLERTSFIIMWLLYLVAGLTIISGLHYIYRGTKTVVELTFAKDDQQ